MLRWSSNSYCICENFELIWLKIARQDFLVLPQIFRLHWRDQAQLYLNRLKSAPAPTLFPVVFCSKCRIDPPRQYLGPRQPLYTTVRPCRYAAPTHCHTYKKKRKMYKQIFPSFKSCLKPSGDDRHAQIFTLRLFCSFESSFFRAMH